MKESPCRDKKRGVAYHIGTSGYSYDDWKGRFYPSEIKRNEWLSHYAEHFDTVELNVTFYRIPSEAMIKAWNRLPKGRFIFAAKGSRRITHFKKLSGVSEVLDNFWERLKMLEPIGVLLWQLPPSFKKDEGRLEGFLEMLPGRVKHVFEFRDESWFGEETFKLLDRYGCGFVSVSHPRLPDLICTSGGLVYLRFHGKGKEMYRYNYSEGELEAWAERLRGVAGGVSDAFIYFNNDFEAHAVSNAKTLKDILLG